MDKSKGNWGFRQAPQWDSVHPVNNGWYGLTANWVVTNNGTYSYNNNVKMIYNLSHTD